MLIAFNKPYGVITRFTRDASSYDTLARFGFPKGVYPIGRLDAETEGLLLLSDEPKWTKLLTDPRSKCPKLYWAQVERVPSPQALSTLMHGVTIQGYRTLPCKAWILEPQPQIGPRNPPIRFRKNVPDCWIAIELFEGKNRQVRRMTAAIGHPTLRLIRVKIGCITLENLMPGQWIEFSPRECNMFWHYLQKRPKELR